MLSIYGKINLTIFIVMQVIEITSLTGHSPFNISICDITLTYCYVVATGVVSVPPTLQLTVPTQLDGANQVLVVVTDSIGCKEFILQTCPTTPTPTPTITPTPTPTRIIICNCISFQNTTSSTLKIEYTNCDGKIFNGAVESGTTLYYCGRLPSAEPGVNIIINDECTNNTCPDSVLTPTPTPTLTPTPTSTLTPTPTPTTVFQFLPVGFYFTDEIDNNTFTYIYGEFTGYTYNNTAVNRLVKLNQDLTIDYSFTGGTGFNASPYYFAYNSITQQPDGKIIATGSFTQYSGVSVNRIVRLNTNGSVDNTFTSGTGFNNFSEGSGLDSLGRIVVVGFFSSYDGNSAPRIVRLNSDGTYDGTFTIGTGFNNTGVEVLINTDDSMYITGYFNSYNGTSVSQGITKLLSTGVIDTTFSGGTGFDTGNNEPNGLMRISGETSFYTFGYFTTYSGVSANRIIKLNSDGTIDGSFNSGTGFNDTVYSGYIIWTNKLVITGAFTDYNGTSSNGTIVLNSDGTIYQTFTNSYEGVFSIGNKLFGQQNAQPIELIATYP